MDIDYNADRDGFKGIVTAKKLLKIFPSNEMIRNIYKIASARCPDDPMLLLQQAIFEMNVDGGSLEKANELLDKGYKLADNAQRKSIMHSKAMLLIKQSDITTNSAERMKLREQAKRLSKDLTVSDSSSHPYHTLIKLGIDEIKYAMELNDEVTFGRKVKEVEESIFKALQAFPMDSFILDAESRFCHLIKADPKALESLKKAFAANKKSPYVASRLAKVYRDMGQMDEAMKVLKECLDVSPSSKDIHFTLAKYIMDYKPDSVTEIIHHLRRSFTQGDINYNAQFWYARSQYLAGEIQEALHVFKFLGDSKANFHLKKDIQAVVFENNKPKLFHGRILKVEHAHAFIVIDGTGDKIFAFRYSGNNTVWEQLKPEKRVVFDLGFNYRGPIAINIKAE